MPAWLSTLGPRAFSSLWTACRFGTFYQTAWEIRILAGTASDICNSMPYTIFVGIVHSYKTLIVWGSVSSPFIILWLPTRRIWRLSKFLKLSNIPNDVKTSLMTQKKSKISGAAILNFGQMAFLVTWSNSGWHFVPSYKIWVKSFNCRRSYSYFTKSKMAAVRFLKF